MTPSQKDKAQAIRDRFAIRRAAVELNFNFANDRVNSAAQEVRAARDEWDALDLLINAPDTTLLVIAEVTGYGRR